MRLAYHFRTFCNEFNKFNKTGERMLEKTYHMALRLLGIISGVKDIRFCHCACNVVIYILTSPENL